MDNEDNKPNPEAVTPNSEVDAGTGQSGSGQTEAEKKQAELEAKNAALEAENAAKEAKKANLEKAIEEAEIELKAKRKAKSESVVENNQPEDETPQIDDNDPAAKAWNKRIQDTVAPVVAGREAEKAEIRKFTIKEFLKDKPAVARDPEKVKELIEMYDRLKENTGLTKEGVLIDLNKAFGAIYHEQLIDAAKTQKFDRVKEMELFSSPGVDEGATGYVNEQTKMPAMSAEDRKILAQWGMTPEEWWAMQQAGPAT